MKQFTKPFIFLLIVLLIAACRKDSSTITDTPIFPNPTVLIETGAKGMVADEDGKPIEGATIRLGQEVTTSNEYGYYEISGKTNAAQPFVRIEKVGYFPSICNFTGRAGEFGRLKSILRTKTLSGRIQAVNGGGIQVSGGGSIEFKAGGFVTSTGQPYTGDVNVYATYLDPTKPETMQMIPGSMLGNNLEGEEQVLVSYGMMNVLLESPSGEKLQINKPATLSTPIPSARLGDAPPSIPLWYIDEATSLWKEDGSATKQGNTYVGEVSHFSWWNFDIGLPQVKVLGRIVIDGNYPFVIVKVTLPNGLTSSCQPDEEGRFGGAAPANETFLLEIFSECDDLLYSENYGPFNSDVDLGNIVLNNNTNWSTISGSLVDCNDQTVSRGLILIDDDSNRYRFPNFVGSTNNPFSILTYNCEEEINITGVDLNSLLATDPKTFLVSNQINTGILKTCDIEFPSKMTIEFGETVIEVPIIRTMITVKTTNKYRKYYIDAVDFQSDVDKASYNWNVIFVRDDDFCGGFGLLVAEITGDATGYNWIWDGEPENYPDIKLILGGTQPGERFIVEASNLDLKNTSTGEIKNDCKVTFDAIMQ